MIRRIAATLTGVLIAVACKGSREQAPASVLKDGAITIGSCDFPESELLAEIYAQALTQAGFTVVRSFDIGPRELVMPALQEGLLEVVPDHEGSALAFLGGTPTSGKGPTFALCARPTEPPDRRSRTR